MRIAIDGPAGAGKSVISALVAERTGFGRLDTGAMYRALGLKALRAGVDVDDAQALEAMLAATELDVRCVEGETRVLLDGEDVSAAIRTQEVSAAASHVSAVGPVRGWLLGKQRAIAAAGDVIMDGRDIGTHVLPDAEVKIYLTASDEVRARRRLDQLRESGAQASYEDVLREVRERDRRDMTREISPLRRADDACLVDSSDMTIEQVVDAIMARVEAARRGMEA